MVPTAILYSQYSSYCPESCRVSNWAHQVLCRVSCFNLSCHIQFFWVLSTKPIQRILAIKVSYLCHILQFQWQCAAQLYAVLRYNQCWKAWQHSKLMCNTCPEWGNGPKMDIWAEARHLRNQMHTSVGRATHPELKHLIAWAPMTQVSLYGEMPLPIVYNEITRLYIVSVHKGCGWWGCVMS